MMLEQVLDLRDSLKALAGAMFGDPSAVPEEKEGCLPSVPPEADENEVPSAA